MTPRKDALLWQHGNFKAPPYTRDENLKQIRKVEAKSGSVRVGTIDVPYLKLLARLD
ncbi:hypothetical protein ACP6PL_09660 [Dapis sp. BLCC M126]|uniref:hypothetical protein n=1 Tax=Dapis sp. BLCC M126 TaxID=3400189 RepID=UPI003CFB579A